MRAGIIVFSGLLAVAYCLPQPQHQPQGGGAPQGFFQYANNPGPKEYEVGWNRGNEHHYISRFEQSKDHKFRTRVKWGDKDGYGEHYWEYNHGPKHKEPEYHAPAPAYSPPKKGYASENIEKVIVAPEGFQRTPTQDGYTSEHIAQIAAAPERYHQRNPNSYEIPNGYGLVDFGHAG